MRNLLNSKHNFGIRLIKIVGKFRIVKACVRYFSLFLKEQCASWLFRTNLNLTYCCFIFPVFHEHLFSPELSRAARLLKLLVLKKQLYV